MSISIFSLAASIQAPQNIDPYNTALNSQEVYPCLTANEQNVVDECIDYIEELTLTKDGKLYLRDKRALMSIHVEVEELYRPEPEYQNLVYIEVSIPTLDERAMPDCYGYHKLIVERHLYF